MGFGVHSNGISSTGTVMKPIGRHVLIEFWGCNDCINDTDVIGQSIHEAVAETGATILNLHVHAFSPQGVTGVAVLAESHMSVHSWPEHAYLAADIFTCGATVDPHAAVLVLRRYFTPTHVEVKEILRGEPPTAAVEAPNSVDFSSTDSQISTE